MKKFLPIYIYGSIIIFEGIFLVLSKDISFLTINHTTGFLLIFGAIFAFVAAFSRQRKQIQFAYHELHALAMLAYGLSILIFCNTIEKVISLTEFLFIFYMLSEVIFCSWLFNLGQKVVFKIIIIRLLLGIAVGIGSVLVLNQSAFQLEGLGILFLLVGINILLYVPVLKSEKTPETR
ncbi:hypothetical protein EGI22_12460 [Lacihabitans sp. LS3-19]|uniref:hypothetical protein n=1 Tax=Lacihabitans sp. LS3-19 TaxID=2487335 RepID=UPI0020CBEF45|nr:hypothetical protein [Lacihabitans sp. LS3-19]MCP9768730.1 hypothetical protein [Lacihabitans sp. LS3-19]